MAFSSRLDHTVCKSSGSARKINPPASAKSMRTWWASASGCARSIASSKVEAISISSRSRRRAPSAHCSARASRSMESSNCSRRPRSSKECSSASWYSSLFRGRCRVCCRVDLSTATGVFSSWAALARNCRCNSNDRRKRSSIWVMASTSGRNSSTCSTCEGMRSSQLRADTRPACEASVCSGRRPLRTPANASPRVKSIRPRLISAI